MKNDDWIGFDLDGTIAYYESGHTGTIGEPIEPMIARLREHLAAGDCVKIMTARANTPKWIPLIQDWLEAQGLPRLEVTSIKDRQMAILYDDNARQVIRNTGQVVGE